jgi:phosphoketolase
MNTTDQSLSTQPTERQLRYIPVPQQPSTTDPLDAMRELASSLLDRIVSVASSLDRIADHMSDCAAVQQHMADQLQEHEAAIRRLHLHIIQADYREREQ